MEREPPRSWSSSWLLLLPLWVMWGVKHFSKDRGAAPRRSFAYQINSGAGDGSANTDGYVACACWGTCIWRLLNISHGAGHGDAIWCVQKPKEMFWTVSFTYRMWHFWFKASKVSIVIKDRPFTLNIIRNFPLKIFYITTKWVYDFKLVNKWGFLLFAKPLLAIKINVSRFSHSNLMFIAPIFRVLNPQGKDARLVFS